MKRSDVPYNPSYYDRYMDQVDDIPINEAFAQSIAAIDALDMNQLHALRDRVYAPGKWTVRDMMLHISDCERVFAYRALRFARNDDTALPGFDESIFAAHSGANLRTLEDIMTELRSVKESTMLMFRSFDDEALRRTGIMSKVEIPVLAIGYTLLGHQKHHLRILEERYLPLLTA